jgi:hypothetical protein
MNSSLPAFRRLILSLTIGCFGIAALMGVLALLVGGSFGETEVRILLTTLIVGSTSVCVLCYLATSGTAYQALGIVGGAVVLLPTGTGLYMVWGDLDDGGPWQAFGIGVVLALTLAQACLLLGLAGSRDNLRWLLWPTLAMAAVVALITSGMILDESGGDDSIWRLLGIVAILDVLGTVVTVAMAKFGSRPDDEPLTAPPRAGIALTGDLAVRLQARAQIESRPTGDLLVEAVERYLGESGRTAGY